MAGHPLGPAARFPLALVEDWRTHQRGKGFRPQPAFGNRRPKETSSQTLCHRGDTGNVEWHEVDWHFLAGLSVLGCHWGATRYVFSIWAGMGNGKSVRGTGKTIRSEVS